MSATSHRVDDEEELAIRILTPEEIRELNRQGGYKGAGLDENGFYFLAFLMNDKPNKAVEPRPFQVPTEHLDPISETAIGMPFVVGPDPFHHVYAASGKPEDIVNLSRQYAWGQIAAKIKNPITNNVWAVVKAFKEYVPRIQRGEMPKYTSPMIAPDNLAEALSTGIINGGRILHLQAVASPGYDPKVARVQGHLCSGMLGKCMKELSTLAAAGKLEEWRRSNTNNSLFSDTHEQKTDPRMGSKNTDPNSSAAFVTPDQLDQKLEEFKGELMESIKTTLGAAGAAAALETDKTKAAGAEEKPAKAKGALSTVKDEEDDGQEGAAGSDAKAKKTTAQSTDGALDLENHPAVKELKDRLDKAEKKAKEEAETRSKVERRELARQITGIEVFLHKTPKAKAAERVKKLEVESEDKLKFLLENLQDMKSRVFAASGAESDDEPAVLTLSASGGGEQQVDYDAVFAGQEAGY